MEFVTLAKDDPDFEPYLLGTFSKTERALPIETNGVQTNRPPTTRERVTFRVVPLATIKVPPWWIIYAAAVRPELIALTLGPAVATWLNHRGAPAWTHWSAWTALFGVFFLHVATFVYNDVVDHVRGADRLNRRRGSRVIQNGWTTAADMKKWAKLNLALAIGCGFPTFVNAPLELLGITAAAALALVALLTNFGTRRGVCDLSLIALFGPLLTCGMAYASFGAADVSDVALGLTFGLITLWVFQVRQFENLFRAKPEAFRTFLGYLNFDGARLTVVVEGLLLLGLMPAAAVIVRVPLVFFLLLPIFGLPLILRVSRIYRAASPLSSDLIHSSRWALAAHFSFTVWWLVALGSTWL